MISPPTNPLRLPLRSISLPLPLRRCQARWQLCHPRRRYGATGRSGRRRWPLSPTPWSRTRTGRRGSIIMISRTQPVAQSTQPALRDRAAARRLQAHAAAVVAGLEVAAALQVARRPLRTASPSDTPWLQLRVVGGGHARRGYTYLDAVHAQSACMVVASSRDTDANEVGGAGTYC
jgi:hypothetical protein